MKSQEILRTPEKSNRKGKIILVSIKYHALVMNFNLCNALHAQGVTNRFLNELYDLDFSLSVIKICGDSIGGHSIRGYSISSHSISCQHQRSLYQR